MAVVYITLSINKLITCPIIVGLLLLYFFVLRQEFYLSPVAPQNLGQNSWCSTHVQKMSLPLQITLKSASLFTPSESGRESKIFY